MDTASVVLNILFDATELDSIHFTVFSLSLWFPGVMEVQESHGILKS